MSVLNMLKALKIWRFFLDFFKLYKIIISCLTNCWSRSTSRSWRESRCWLRWVSCCWSRSYSWSRYWSRCWSHSVSCCWLNARCSKSLRVCIHQRNQQTHQRRRHKSLHFEYLKKSTTRKKYLKITARKKIDVAGLNGESKLIMFVYWGWFRMHFWRLGGTWDLGI